MKTVVIDPGHGGYDYGAVNGDRYEKNDNLRLGLAVRDKLKAQGQGVNVVMTRDTDAFVPLSDRSYISNANNADMFVSLHRNASTNPAGNGVETYIHTNPSAAARGYAENVLSRVADAGVQSNRGVKQSNFAVLRNTYAPAQLLELGFVSNDADNGLFDANFDAYAEAIAKSIAESLGLPYGAPPAPAPGPPGGNAAAIRGIQSTLNRLYGTGLAADGLYGPATKRGLVKGLQTELNSQYGARLATDGIFGPATRAAVRNIRRPMTGNIVYLLQAALIANGYGVGADGIFGPATEAALKNYQRAKGLTADGIAGAATFSALLL
jgi:N-acetylmuramoyl-L-alanine amidase